MAGRPWVAHEYLTDILMYVIHHAGGFLLLDVVNALILCFAFGILAHNARAPRWIAYASAILAAFAARPAFAIRPQSISLALGAAFFCIVRYSLREHQPRILLSLPLLMILWVQLHAGYLLGILFIGLLLTAEILDYPLRRSNSAPKDWLPVAASGIACIAVVPINPHGFTMWTYPFYVMRMKINATIQEWRPANLHDPHLRLFIILAIVTLLAMLFSREKYRPGAFFLYAVLLTAALRSGRNIPLFCIVALILLSEHLWLPTAITRIPTLVRFAVATAALAVAAWFCSVSAANGLAFQALAEKNLYPRDATTYLQSHHLPPNLLNDYAFGGYLIWRLYPQYKVYVDGRSDLYGDPFLADYLEIYQGHLSPESLLDAHHINTVILAPSGDLTSLFRMISVRGDWILSYEDPHAVIFVRKNPLPVTQVTY